MYLLDTDFLYACFFANQSTHKKAAQIMANIKDDKKYASNLVLHELAAVMSNKESQKESIEIIKACRILGLEIIFMNESNETEAWKLFESQTKNKTSFIDCANLYLATKYDLQIASFDSFYPNHILIKP
jgi:predicted nucleic acid-binding protein